MIVYRLIIFSIFILFNLLWLPAYAEANLEACLQQALITAPDSITLGEMRERCQQKVSSKPSNFKTEKTPVEKRIEAEKAIEERPFVLSTHQPNFILPITYMDDPNKQPFEAIGDDINLDNEEVVFQISFKVPIVLDLFDTDSDFFFGYTSRSWWQMYNGGLSAAFRETNYKPELFVRYYGGPSFFGFDMAGWDVGLVHESNGRSEILSRSWNRAFIATMLDADDLSLLFKAWYRFPESEEDDDNPKIHRYLGYGEMRVIYVPNENTFTAMLRPGTEKYGVEITWSRPISDNLRLYALYYNGYGESLLDYNHHIERFGIGIVFNDFLQRRNSKYE